MGKLKVDIAAEEEGRGKERGKKREGLIIPSRPACILYTNPIGRRAHPLAPRSLFSSHLSMRRLLMDGATANTSVGEAPQRSLWVQTHTEKKKWRCSDWTRQSPTGGGRRALGRDPLPGDAPVDGGPSYWWACRAMVVRGERQRGEGRKGGKGHHPRVKERLWSAAAQRRNYASLFFVMT